MRQPVSSLSGGERNRLLLARALASPSNVLVLDEPTNDLDMETLDLLADMLGDYEGTLILVSHDRDFIDRLATSTIGLDGRGRAVETPGGWVDFLEQNPGFLDPADAPSPPKLARTPAPRSAPPPVKLSFKDQHRLTELEKSLPVLASQIGRLEHDLADPALFGRDRHAFERSTKALDKARAALIAAETAWFELEERREALTLGAAARSA